MVLEIACKHLVGLVYNAHLDVLGSVRPFLGKVRLDLSYGAHNNLRASSKGKQKCVSAMARTKAVREKRDVGRVCCFGAKTNLSCNLFALRRTSDLFFALFVTHAEDELNLESGVLCKLCEDACDLVCEQICVAENDGLI